MALLAERKQKQKFGHDPLNKNWSSDDNKFGQKLMEKMGWEKGKGLGANETGMVDHIKAAYKFDNRGLGFTPEGGDAWISHQEDFDDLLKKLNEGSNTESQPEPDKADGRKRYYGKFARGRVATLRSTEDLDCIFGKRKNSSKPSTPSSQSAANSDEEAPKGSDAEGESSHGLKTVTSTSSVQEYFAEKMKALKEKRKAKTEGEEDCPGEQESQAGQTSTQEKRVPAVFGAVGFTYDDPVQEDDSSESARDAGVEISSRDHVNDNKTTKAAGSMEDCPDQERKKKKKKKKNKHTDRATQESEQETNESRETQQDVSQGASAEVDVTQNKKSRKRKLKADACEVVCDEIVGELSKGGSSEEGRKKKKKRKKSARDKADDEGNGNECMETESKMDFCEDEMEDVEESGSQAAEINTEDKKKKKKKTKKKRKETCESEEEKPDSSKVKSKKEEENSKGGENKKMDDSNPENEATQAEEETRDETSTKIKGKKRKSSQVDPSNVSEHTEKAKTPEPPSDRKRKRAKYFSKKDSDSLKNAFNGSNIIEINGYKLDDPSKKKKRKNKRR